MNCMELRSNTLLIFQLNQNQNVCDKSYLCEEPSFSLLHFYVS